MIDIAHIKENLLFSYISSTLLLVIGVGLTKGVSHLDLGSIGRIVLSWVVTIPAGAALTIIFYYLFKFTFEI